MEQPGRPWRIYRDYARHSRHTRLLLPTADYTGLHCPAHTTLDYTTAMRLKQFTDWMPAQARLSGCGANFNNFKLLSCAAIAETTATRIWQYYQQQLQPSMGVSISLCMCVCVWGNRQATATATGMCSSIVKILWNATIWKIQPILLLLLLHVTTAHQQWHKGSQSGEEEGGQEGSWKPCQWLNWHTVHVVHMLPLGNTFVSPFLFVTNLQFRFFTLFKFICHPPISHRLPPPTELLTWSVF